MKKVLIIGSTVADIIINLPQLPLSTQDVNIDSQEMSLGGCAYNVSDMLRHFQVPYTLFSPIGSGIYGDYIRKKLAEKGLSSPVPSPEEPNGCCYCFVEAGGERTFVCDHGAEYIFKREWFDALDTSEIASIYICGLEIEDKTGSVIVNFLESNPEIPLFFAPGPRICYIDIELMNRIFALHPVVHMNKSELYQFTECDDLDTSIARLYNKTGNTVIVTSGSDGAFFFNGKTRGKIPAVKTENIIDTIGAGDSHIGTVIACLYKGLSLHDSVLTANRVASMVVSKKGATLSDEEFNMTE